MNCKGDLGSTPLHYAASRGHSEIAQELLQSGADPTITNEFGQTPLDLAVPMKRGNVVNLLQARA